MNNKINIAVIGATGNVGRLLIDILYERQLPIRHLYCISNNLIGHNISFGQQNIVTQSIKNFDFRGINIVFSCVNAQVAKSIIPQIVSAGAKVIDKSSYFRLKNDIPLVIPEINIDTITTNSRIISSPNCCVVPLILVLKPLDDVAKIKKLVIATYQSTSGAGKAAMEELDMQTRNRYLEQSKTLTPQIFPKQIAFNIIPQIGMIMENGRCDEEDKIIREIQKIIGRQIAISITCVRVPTFVSHAFAVNVEFEYDLSVKDAESLLVKLNGIKLISNVKNSMSNTSSDIVTPVDVTGKNDVFVSRVRKEKNIKNSLSLWISTDNLRKGSALNAVQIAENILLQQKLI
ncbi:aspartate-semialdehyde dehydrogenase [Orientia tsutsugamushi]|uniref:aspartate-semialdehyde dehydrogenase n=1 Tax=Orientia tsutsugamushi TaxID=784 RepID=UPI0005F8ADC4|nr:aspartate-semialdehyde dehydrogenase [Orientia tsutsugamushi]KJV74611.1 aspartate-semialdehyde dehydrogenase [Orientia tsutsugamushi str. TA763]SPP24654.1 aspartate-semialdehyde dehydrogenase [Orientia tsutsugamushi]